MTDQSHILITGCSSGIGLATTQLLLSKGYRVLGLSREPSRANIDDAAFVPVKADLADLAQLETSLKGLLKDYRVNSLVHSAGQGLFGSLEQFSVKQIDRNIRINLSSALVICRQLLPAMRQQGNGRLIFIGSESALNGGKQGSLYCAAKFGLRGLSQSLRVDCAADGISVSLVNPGMVRSPFFEDLSFAPGERRENAIEVEDVALQIWQLLQVPQHLVVDEINLSPMIKSLQFKKNDR